MPADIRDYLLDRFRTDASTLRQRAEALRNEKKPSPGPNAELSLAMAGACDDVVRMAEALPEHAPVDVMIDALKAMVPELMARANSGLAAASPALRSVYVGACTRAQELIAAELAALNAAPGEEYEDADVDDLDDDDVDEADDDVDDDDLYDEQQHEDHRQ